ncbi:myosin-6-like protein [Carex littledalei]|uniref:Myosin-6-like protein n=1 Tax=Carex littledalei TaxID=544730 RepID=A0A833V1W5_9POAL|nr:myosin-6-like protein [Carex littledalei]
MRELVDTVSDLSKFSKEKMEDQNAQVKILELNNLVKSLQENLALIEAENQVLRKHISASSLKQNSDGNSTSQLSAQDHKEGIEALIDCVVHRVGIVAGKSVVALTIYKCLLNWKCFEAEKTCVFDRLLQMFDSASKGFGASTTNGVMAHRVEAKYPALLFKLQLTTLVETMYTVTRENLKKDLTPLLSLAIQAPRAAKASLVRGQSFKTSDSPRKSFSDARFANSIPESPRKSFSDARTISFKNSMQESHWKSITDNLSDSYVILQENGIPAVLIERMMCQIFSFINIQLFNSILLRRECCTFSNGEYLKYGLSELQAWCEKLEEQHIGSAWDKLEHINQATAFLVTLQKFKISYEDLTQNICSALNVQQLYRICTQYWDDKYNSQTVSPNVLNNMRTLMTDETSDVDSSDFLLDDDTSIPFTLFEIYNAVEDKEFSQFTIPKEILDISALKLSQP